MAKKLLALTMTLVLVAGVAAFGSMSGSWNNELTLAPQTNPITGLESVLTVNYSTGGVSYESVSTFDLTGYDDQTFSVSGTVGLLDLASELDFDPQSVSMDYWKNTASLTLGGISVTDVFLLQNVKDNPLYSTTSNPPFDGYGSGMELSVSGETPGGVTVDVANYFGMEPVDDTGLVTGIDYTGIPEDSGYAIMGGHTQTNSAVYAPSSMQYVATQIELSGLALGCCEFTSDTLFSEMNGFEYTEFEFMIASNSMPLTLDADLKFTEQTKSIELTPSLDLAWACFDVYTDLSGTLANNSQTGDEIEGLVIEGFSLTGIQMGHITFSSYTALAGHDVNELNDDFLDDYDEVFRIEKSDTLDLTVDVYFDMTQSQQLFDLAYIDTLAEFELSDQFLLGTGIQVAPGTGLDNITLSLDYTF